MIKIFNKFQINSTIFIVVSVGALVLFVLIYVLIFNLGQSVLYPAPMVSDKYYLNSAYKVGDPLITKEPGLKDALAGPIISANDPSYGKSDAPVTIVIFSDFQCTFCHEQEQGLKKAINDNQDSVRLIWKDYPDMSVNNSESYQAAIAGRCADAQDKFWEYHDLLFGSNKKLDKSVFIDLAKELDLDTKDFQKCLDSENAKKLVYENVLEANALNINGIPFVYINDKEVLGQSTSEDLIKLIRAELKQEK
jgi:predicted DsbA family dithiol-disulfide isomerase